MQTPRRITHARVRSEPPINDRKFNYALDYKKLDVRANPELYRVGVGEQGVLLIEPYKSEILPHWKFKDPKAAKKSAGEIYKKFLTYLKAEDFVGADLARKFLQMGFTRSRRYANHKSGRKYKANGEILNFDNDAVKARSAEIFKTFWKKAEAHPVYSDMKANWRAAFG